MYVQMNLWGSEMEFFGEGNSENQFEPGRKIFSENIFLTNLPEFTLEF